MVIDTMLAAKIQNKKANQTLSEQERSLTILTMSGSKCILSVSESSASHEDSTKRKLPSAQFTTFSTEGS